ncbi:MAG: FG-GAP-like repeat-containing protein [Planctomycetaceae bacterium]
MNLTSVVEFLRNVGNSRRSRRRHRASATAAPSELLEYRTLLAADFGDAPEPFAVILAEQGARHEAIGPMLGASRDTEADGMHSNAADADGSDDGVTFSELHVGQYDASVTVNVQNAAGGAKLDAWIDFNRDGQWNAAVEQVFDSVSVVEGDNVLSFDVPSGAVGGQLVARFRLSTAGNLQPGGSAPDGEVEDYSINVAGLAAGSRHFGGVNILRGGSSITALQSADMDGDGDTDLVTSSSLDDLVLWHENLDGERFASHVISDNVMSASDVFIVDLDADGDFDVISTASGNGRLAWHENDGQQQFTTHVITVTSVLPSTVMALDFDADGDLDLLTDAGSGGRPAWFENDGMQSFTAHEISGASGIESPLFGGDVDGDMDSDVLAISYNSNFVTLFQNNGNQQFSRRTIIVAASNIVGATASDLDSDGDIDVVVVTDSGSVLTWYENDGQATFTPRTISTGLDLVGLLRAVDFDGDGDMDIIATSNGSQGITLLVNDGSLNFLTVPVTTAHTGMSHALAADIDGDGLMDLVGASTQLRPRLTNESFAWYRNLGGQQFSALRHVQRPPATADLASADVDSDGDTDVIVALSGENTVVWYENDGGQFVGTHNVSERAGNVSRVFAIDIDADGDIDVLTAAGADNQLALHINDGQQVFSELIVSTAIRTPVDVIATDVDGDGDLDIVAAGTEPRLVWFENDGSLTFTSHTIIAGLPSDTDFFVRQSISAMDLDGDGDEDLLRTAGEFNTIEWLENDGSGNFTSRMIDNAASRAASAVAADFDGDGDMDIAGGSAKYGTALVWYENDGAQQFTERLIETIDYRNSTTVGSIEAADIDGDGDLDLVNNGFGNLPPWLFRNNGAGSFSVEFIDEIRGAAVVDLADLNGDGFPELLTESEFFLPHLRWYPNVPAAFDYGDALAAYGVTASADGPRHAIDSAAAVLGSGVDAEPDGQPDSNSLGDDADGADDGVVFPVGIVPGQRNLFEVTASDAGYLHAWIDLNHNLIFEPSEMIFDNRQVAPGTNSLTVTVSAATALAGETTARFRLTSRFIRRTPEFRDARPTGFFSDGEVEDYSVTLLPGVPGVAPQVNRGFEIARLPIRVA